MPTRTRCLILLVALVCFGCGNPKLAERSTTDDARSTAARPATAQPLQLRRTGGIAGFDDSLTVAPDGTAALTTRAGLRRSCQLPPELLARARAVAWAALPGTAEPAGRSDVMRFVVEVGGHVTVLDADAPSPAQAVAVDTAAALFAAVENCPPAP